MRLPAAAARLAHGFPARAAGGGAGHRTARAACRPAHALGARHAADHAPGEHAVRAGPAAAPAAVLLHLRLLLHVRAAAHRLPHLAAGLPVLRPERHRRLAAGDHRLCRLAHVPFGGDDVAPQRPQPALLLGGDLRGLAGRAAAAGDDPDPAGPQEGQVQRHRQRRHAGRRLSRHQGGAAQSHPAVPAGGGLPDRPVRHRHHLRPAVPGLSAQHHLVRHVPHPGLGQHRRRPRARAVPPPRAGGRRCAGGAARGKRHRHSLPQHQHLALRRQARNRPAAGAGGRRRGAGGVPHLRRGDRAARQRAALGGVGRVPDLHHRNDAGAVRRGAAVLRTPRRLAALGSLAEGQAAGRAQGCGDGDIGGGVPQIPLRHGQARQARRGAAGQGAGLQRAPAACGLVRACRSVTCGGRPGRGTRDGDTASGHRRWRGWRGSGAGDAGGSGCSATFAAAAHNPAERATHHAAASFLRHAVHTPHGHHTAVRCSAIRRPARAIRAPRAGGGRPGPARRRCRPARAT